MTELDRLKQDHAAVNVARDIYDRDYKGCDWKAMIGIMEKRIAKLEAEADPWREAKEMLADKALFRSGRSRLKPVAELYDHLTAENARLAKRVAELENPDVSDQDGYTLGDFAVLKTAQEIIRYAMDRNPDRFDDTRICRRAIAAIADFAEKVRHWRGLKNQLPYRWGSLGRDTAHLLDLSFDVTESPADYDPDLVRPIATPQPPSETAWVESELAKFIEADASAGFKDSREKFFDEPGPLDPARVLATARTYLNNSKDDMHGSISYLMWCHIKESQDAKPYRLKGGDDVG